MISVEKLGVQFSGHFLFEDVTFLITPKDRIGLVGLNGSGKSTLLKTMGGALKQEEGHIVKNKSTTIGYLPQEMQALRGSTVFDETSKAFEKVNAVKKSLDETNHKLNNFEDYMSDEYSNLLEKQQELEDQFRNLGGYSMDADIEQILLGLGFERKDFTRLTDEFSGGWQMRIELAKLLLQKPSLLLLDEPTNHLDIESLTWLEDFLKTYEGAIMMVSHDRLFLDNICKRTIEITYGKIYDQKMPYSQYVEIKQQRREQQRSEAKNQEKTIKRLNENINKFRAKKNKAKFAQTLIRKVENMEKIVVEEEEIRAMNIRFPESRSSGKLVLEVKGLSKSYDDNLVLKDLNFTITKGERIAFVGRNGEGKTTLARVISGDLKYDGELKIGHNVEIGTFTQHVTDMLDLEKTVFQTIDDAAVGEMRSKVRGILGAFLFSGDSVDKKVKVLSGGEKGRLAMAKLMLEPSNLLILDEPTNHLDMISKDLLKNALANYPGTLIIVSHDRQFLEGLTDRIFEFKNKRIREHIGGIHEFLRHNKAENFRKYDEGDNSKTTAKTEKKKPANDGLSNKEAFEQKKALEKQEKKLKNKINRLEGEIDLLENSIKDLEATMAQPDKYGNPEELQKLLQVYEKNKDELDEKLGQWDISLKELKKLGQ